MPAVAAAGMLGCLVLACYAGGERLACRGGERARLWGVVCGCMPLSAERPQRARAAAMRLIASAVHVCVHQRYAFDMAMGYG